MNDDIRWIQRLNHFSKAFDQLTRFIDKGTLNELEEQGLIQSFEYTYELAWNTLKDYFEAPGEIKINGSRDAFRLAFRREIIKRGDTWMEMVKSRTLTSHTFNEDIAKQIVSAIRDQYYIEFKSLQNKLNSLKESNG